MLENPQWKITCATNGDGEIAMQWWLSGKTMDEYFTDFIITKTLDENGKKDGWKRLDKINKQTKLF